MKRVLIICCAIIIMSLLLSSCTSNGSNSYDKPSKTVSNPFDFSSEEESDSVGFGFGPVNPVDKLTYTGKPIEREYLYENTGNVDCKLGFMIFIDGIPQAYKVDDESTEEIMHQFSVSRKDKIKFKVSLKPTIGEKDNVYGLYAVTLLNPSFMPASDIPNPTFGNNHTLSQVLPVTLKYLESVKSPILKVNSKYSTQMVNDEIKKEYLSQSKDNKNEYVPNGAHLFHLIYKDDYKQTKIEITKGSNLNLKLEGFCGPEDASYRTTVFIDNKPVKTFDGHDYLEMQLKKGMLSSQDFCIDTKGLTGSYTLSTISVPVGNDYVRPQNPVVQTNCRLLVIKE